MYTRSSSVRKGNENPSYYDIYESRALALDDIVTKNDILHIQMTEVPKAYYTTMKSRKGLQLGFYNSLLQITERNNGMVFDLDTLEEVDYIENIDQMQEPDAMINTGFIMFTSRDVFGEKETF